MEYRSTCRFCDKEMIMAINLSQMNELYPLAGGFMRSPDEFKNEEVYPLSLMLCQSCSLLQCGQIISSDKLFKQGYFYYSSQIPMLVNHFNQYAQHVYDLVKDISNPFIIEIGCNDGVFLKPLKQLGLNVIGVDPSNTINNEFTVYNDYFTPQLAEQIIQEHGQCDVFLSSNSFAHIDDMKSIMKAMKMVLKPDGRALIEVHYMKTILDDMNFDFIYHEHMSYYSVTSFYNIAKMYDMTLENVIETNIHGKSIRVYLRNKVGDINEKINGYIKNEKYLSDIQTYREYEKKIYDWKYRFMKTIEQIEKPLYGYGSSGRANILCQFSGLKLDVIVDDSESKIGSYTPIDHIQIQSSSILKDYKGSVILLAWPYAEYIIKKWPDIKFIVPLPEIWRTK